ncbi:MAG: phosphomannomutase [Deferrisomatales bacterium]|nr:phosphomannomutase [Deferrisomatales bacterium]
MQIHIQQLMEDSGVGFGTSGARGLAEAMTDRVCYAYTRGFLQHLASTGELRGGERVAIAGDLRPSTDRILAAVRRGAADAGYRPVLCGKLPSPAIALYGISEGIPAVMVTGSHIPADRNGIKFNKRAGEILKDDEAGIRAQVVTVDAALFDPGGRFRTADVRSVETSDAARRGYLARYREFFPPGCLHGLRLGVYQHSAVGRDLLLEIVRGLGAEAVALAPSEAFIPVDTEAIRPEDVALARGWAADLGLDAVLSTDGDSDRPLLADERGEWLRGDVAGILCARYLDADAVVTPVSCNSAVEQCGWFAEVRRTRIGSPYVIEAMLEAVAAGRERVVGYEANGGFLTASDMRLDGRTLVALPTRDAVMLLLGVLLLARREGKTLSALTGELPARYTASDRLQAFPPDASRAVLARFETGDPEADRAAAEALFGSLSGTLVAVDRTDGVRLTFASGEVVHLRPSGNAPEFRCYTEAASPGRAAELNAACLVVLGGLRAGREG